MPVVGTPRVGLTAQLFYGVTVSGATTYTQITNVESIDGPDASLSIVEVTPLGANYKGKLPSISDSGEVTFTIYYDGTDTTHIFLRNLLGTQTLVPWKITFPDASVCTFSGFLSAFATKGMEAESAVTAEATISINGALIFA